MGEVDDTQAAGAAERVATFDIDVTFSPGTIDPDAISERLRLTPTWMWRAGERVRNPNGSVRPHPARESRWSLTLAYFDRREDDLDVWNETDEDLGPRLNDRLKEFLEPLVRHASFVREVVADSTRADITLNFPGQFHFGFVIEPGTLRAVADLNLRFGIEIFRDSAGPDVVGDPDTGVPLRTVGNWFIQSPKSKSSRINLAEMTRRSQRGMGRW